jgi:hypothetical protein
MMALWGFFLGAAACYSFLFFTRTGLRLAAHMVIAVLKSPSSSRPATPQERLADTTAHFLYEMGRIVYEAPDLAEDERTHERIADVLSATLAEIRTIVREAKTHAT